MVEVLQVQPSKQLDSKEILAHSLDVLLERYLQLLDQYNALQQSLAQLLSRGYLLIARANFSNPNRVRYGQEQYDNRMQASTRVSIRQSSPNFSSLEPSVQEITPASESDNEDDKIDLAERSTLTGQASPPPRGTETLSNVTQDPLKWFGILVPPTLRASQSSFRDAVADLIPALASVSKEMTEVELEVRRARKRLRKAV